ncbi:hypothetical protein ACIA39_05405 [Lactobacillus delbrueckii subsp. bulgaricus]|uniref:hypothetical protein n=1 Tax=Lactobacillus delbrueckii TaxID=1584 RepID=UPI0037C57787
MKTDFIGKEATGSTLESFFAGQATNMIPAVATAVVSGENLEKIAAAFPDFLAKKGLTGEIKETASKNGNCLKISLEGVSAHASVPWEGKNGACLLDSLDTAHAIDESVSLAELEKSLAIYAEAIYELTK